MSDNNCTLIFNRPDVFTKVKYIDKTRDCTPGQPCDLPIVGYVNETVDVNLICDREGSGQVAETFKGWCNNDWQHAIAVTHNAYLPDELNFCFQLQLSYPNGATQDIFLGQGHVLGSNNWWLGSLGIGRMGDNVPILHAADGTDWKIIPNTHSFDFEAM